MRVGIGTDRHRLVFGKKLILGGVKVEAPKGAFGHSDADALTHAVIDALLGAAGLGDIGHHFPDNDPKFKDADSIELLKKTLEILSLAGYAPINIDSSVHLEQPKLGRLKQEMAATIADALKIPRHRVNVKAKTGEGMDAVGKGDCVEAFAIAQVESVREHTSMLPKP
ncbi:MAG TPA: 2-C-methyl-D-erythritol 2,4-cyclodiphosphate synthase [Planctomycetota bacterium]|nr:2-C-methyl-D-erythritol 2,4-cyclodiphosphate synthase [Planctomycetota bacterium]